MKNKKNKTYKEIEDKKKKIKKKIMTKIILLIHFYQLTLILK
jgi:hypothetical protein